MKKNILIALVALLAIALNGNAQNNTYNMVIEMANGTKITIGPNDVRNISFNDGELVMTGEDINTLVEQQSKTEERIDSLAKEDNYHHLYAATMIADLDYRLAEVIQRSQETKDSLDQLKNNVEEIDDLFGYLKTQIQTLFDRLDSLESKIGE